MSAIKDGGLAFPAEGPSAGQFEHPGMTLRDYFAAKALQGICAASPTVEWTDQRIAEDAYRLADAMLATREANHD